MFSGGFGGGGRGIGKSAKMLRERTAIDGIYVYEMDCRLCGVAIVA